MAAVGPSKLKWSFTDTGVVDVADWTVKQDSDSEQTRSDLKSLKYVHRMPPSL